MSYDAMKQFAACRAAEYLAKRYEDICFAFPLTRQYVSLEGYIKANLPYVLRRYQHETASLPR